MFEYQKLNQRVRDSILKLSSDNNHKTDVHEMALNFLENILKDIQHKAGLMYTPINNLPADNHWTTFNLSPHFQHQIDTQRR